MRKSLIILQAFILMSILLIGCGGGDGGDNDSNITSNSIVEKTPIVEETQPQIIGNVEDKYYGKWVFAENGSEININTTTILNYIASNDNLLIVTEDDGTKKSYIRAGISKINLKGRLEQQSVTSSVPVKNSISKSSAYSSIGNIDVILENITDKNIKVTITTDENGYFEDSSLPSGDYTITAEESDININTNVTINEKDEDLGTFILTDKTQHNFKAELVLNNNFIYASKEKSTITLRVNNISDTKAIGIWFDIKLIDEDGIEYDKKDIDYSDTTINDSSIGTILQKSYSDINISCSFEPIIQNNKDVTIEITIHDAENNTWTENLKFVLYKDSFKVNIDTSASNLKGYIRFPYNDQVLAINMEKGSITLPLLNNDKSYVLVLANSGTLGAETKYSIGLNTPTLSLKDFKNTGAYENDDTEDEATTFAIGDNAIISYIHFGDLDYWKIVTPQIDKLINLAPTANAGVDQTVMEEQLVTLNASNSKDSDGSIVSYQWKEGSTVLSNNKSFTISDFTVGNHAITLMVTDNNGRTDTDATVITITKFMMIHNGLSYGRIVSKDTGKIWLDRNLGANRVCVDVNDSECFGDYYQWGRNTDGHEKLNSYTTHIQATDIKNAGSLFILGDDWAYSLDPDKSLRSYNWSKIDGSSVCPLGYRVPTNNELGLEKDVYTKPFNLPLSGRRLNTDGSYGQNNTHSYLYSSEGSYFINTTNSYHSIIIACPVRCIKD